MAGVTFCKFSGDFLFYREIPLGISGGSDLFLIYVERPPGISDATDFSCSMEKYLQGF